MDKPELLVIGGPNGSGKTTLAMEYVARSWSVYLSADDIAARLSPGNPEKVAIQAARIFSSELLKVMDSREPIVIESTLAGLSFRHTLALAKEKGYLITIPFVFVESVDLCVARIAERVASGGHSVPERDVRRRFSRSIYNFWHIYKEIADSWSLFYNLEQSPRQVAVGSGTDWVVLDDVIFERWKEVVKEIRQ